MLNCYTSRFIRWTRLAGFTLLLAACCHSGQAQNVLVTEGFENGLGPAFTVNNNEFSISSSRSNTGSNSAGNLTQNGNAVNVDYEPSILGNGRKVDSVKFYFWEESGNNGVRWRLLDGAGNLLTSPSTDNPQWRIASDGSGSCFTLLRTGDYGVWTEVVVEFDWANGEYTATYEQVSGSDKASTTRDLASGTNLGEIEIKAGGNTCISSASDEFLVDDITIYGTFNRKPIANFSGPDTAYVGRSYCIESSSKRSTGNEWFIDGSKETSGNQLDYKATTPTGNRKIMLVASNPRGKDTFTKTITVANPSQPNTDFLTSENVVDKLDQVQFKDLTTGGPSSWQWTIPNGLRGRDYLYPSVSGGGNNPVTLEVKVHGDLGSGDEVYDVLDENGNVLKSGVTGGSDCSSNFDVNTTINLSVSQLRGYLQDGTFSITIDTRGIGFFTVDPICDQNDGFQNDNTTAEGKFELSYPTGKGCLTVESETSSIEGCGSYNRSFSNEEDCDFTLSASGLPQPSSQTPFNNDTSQNPEVLFVQSGYYDVCLEASNNVGQDKKCKNDYIIVREDYDICQDERSEDFYGLITDGSNANSNYGNNQNCSFTISPCANNIFLQLEKFDLAQGDFLRIYDGTDTSGKPLWNTQKYGMQGLTGRISDRDLNKVRNATSGSAYVQFESDGSGNAEGFELGWQSDTGSFPAPQPGFTVADTVCPSAQFTVKDTSIGKNLNYTWVFGTDTIENQQNPSYTFSNAGVKDIELIVNGCGGVNTVTKQIQVRSTSGPPSGSLMASDTTPLEGNSINLTSTASRCVSYYKWEFSGSRATFTNGSSSSDPNPSVAFLSTGAVDVTLTIGNANDTVSITRPDYINVKCRPSVTTLNSDIGISRVKLGNLDNNSPIGLNAYTDYYDSKSALVELNDTQVLRIERSTPINAQNVKVWVDLDQDNDFNDQNELLTKFDSSVKRVYMDTFVLSKTKYLGDVRMRIGANISDFSNTPCGINRVGEFEDYKLKIRKDQTPPTFDLVGADTLSLQACQSISTLDTGAIAFDNLQGRLGRASSTVNVDSSLSGLYEIIYTASDSSGNTASTTQYVRVLPENQPPQISLNGPSNIVVGVNASYTDPGYSGLSDGCSGVKGVDTVNPVNTNVLGTYRVQYTAFDNEGNSNTVTRMVEVADTTKPNLQLAGSNPENVSLDGIYQEAGIASVSDNFYDSQDLETTISGSVNTSKRDTFTITYTVSDPSGNKRMVEREVQVVDQTAPVVSTSLLLGDTLQGTVTVPVNTSLNVEGQVTISDNAGANNVSIRREGDYFDQTNANDEVTSLGTYDARYVFADAAGNETTLALDVTVIDEIAPEITLKGDKTINLKRFAVTRFAKDFDSGAVATDNHEIQSTKIDTTSSYFSEYASNDSTAYSPGYYEIAYEATDSAGNTTREIRVVNVKTETTGLSDANKGEGMFKAYPNPTKGNVTVELNLANKTQGRLSLMNNLGQTVEVIHDGMLNKQDIRLNLDDHSGGVYYLQLETNKETLIQKLIVQ